MAAGAEVPTGRRVGPNDPEWTAPRYCERQIVGTAAGTAGPRTPFAPALEFFLSLLAATSRSDSPTVACYKSAKSFLGPGALLCQVSSGREALNHAWDRRVPITQRPH